MSGFFELLVILFFLGAAVFDAVQRNRKKAERKRKMEEHEANAEAPPTLRQRREREARERSDAEEQAGDDADERPASEMVPQDLWQILTGQQPDPEMEREDRRGDPDPPAEPEIPVPVPSDRTRDSRRANSREPSGTASTLDEPWDRFEDISKGEILEGEGRVQTSVDTAARPGRVRSSSRKGASPYASMLQSGRREDLRRAIVLREVLGRPVGFREPGDDRVL